MRSAKWDWNQGSADGVLMGVVILRKWDVAVRISPRRGVVPPIDPSVVNDGAGSAPAPRRAGVTRPRASASASRAGVTRRLASASASRPPQPAQCQAQQPRPRPSSSNARHAEVPLSGPNQGTDDGLGRGHPIRPDLGPRGTSSLAQPSRSTAPFRAESLADGLELPAVDALVQAEQAVPLVRVDRAEP